LRGGQTCAQHTGTGRIGDKVWDDLNANGIQDPGEPGMENVAVTLYTEGGQYVDSTTTDHYGEYEFDGVDSGTFFLQFDAPYGYTFTAQDVGHDDTVDSDADLSGRTDPFNFDGTEDMTRDAGLVKLPYGSVGDFVWQDLNADGLQDPREPGFPGVEVKLYTSTGEFFAGTVTDQYGYYQFDDVAPGA